MIAMLLAAGRGERLRPLTDSVPKALVEVAGQPLIERHLRALATTGVTTVVINLGWLGASIRDRLGSGSDFGLNIIYSDEGDNILETGGGITRALPFLGDEPFLVVNADIVTDFAFGNLALDDSDDVHLLLVDKPADRASGDFSLADGRLVNEPAAHVFSGIARYHPRFFAGCEPTRFSVAPLLRKAAEEGRAAATLYPGYWADVGTPERLADADKALI